MSVLHAIETRNLELLKREWNYLCSSPFTDKSIKKQYSGLKKWIREGDPDISEFIIRKLTDFKQLFIVVYRELYYNNTIIDLYSSKILSNNKNYNNTYDNIDKVYIYHYISKIEQLLVHAIDSHPDIFTKIIKEINLINMIQDLNRKTPFNFDELKDNIIINFTSKKINYESINRNIIDLDTYVIITNILEYSIKIKRAKLSSYTKTLLILYRLFLDFDDEYGILPYKNLVVTATFESFLFSFSLIDDTDPYTQEIIASLFDAMDRYSKFHKMNPDVTINIRETDTIYDIMLNNVHTFTEIPNRPNIIVKLTFLEYFILKEKYCIVRMYTTNSLNKMLAMGDIASALTFTRVLWFAAFIKNEKIIDYILDHVIPYSKYLVGLEVNYTEFIGYGIKCLSLIHNHARGTNNSISIDFKFKHFDIKILEDAYYLLCRKLGITPCEYQLYKINKNVIEKLGVIDEY
jgi:hypothetical protein